MLFVQKSRMEKFFNLVRPPFREAPIRSDGKQPRSKPASDVEKTLRLVLLCEGLLSLRPLGLISPNERILKARR